MNRMHGVTATGKKAERMAQHGRNGDTEMAHTTVGEVVVPHTVQNQQVDGVPVKSLLHKAFTQSGVPMSRYTVQPTGDSNSQNPQTGNKEFFLDKIIKAAAPVVGGMLGGPAGAAAGSALAGIVGGGSGGAVAGGGAMQQAGTTPLTPAVEALGKTGQKVTGITQEQAGSYQGGNNKQLEDPVSPPMAQDRSEDQNVARDTSKSALMRAITLQGGVMPVVNEVTGLRQYFDASPSKNMKTGMQEYYDPRKIQQRNAMYSGVRGSNNNRFTGKQEFFDPAFYLKNNPDVAANPYFAANPQAHYLQYGKNEGRAADPVPARAPSVPSAPVTASRQSAATQGTPAASAPAGNKKVVNATNTKVVFSDGSTMSAGEFYRSLADSLGGTDQATRNLQEYVGTDYSKPSIYSNMTLNPAIPDTAGTFSDPSRLVGYQMPGEKQAADTTPTSFAPPKSDVRKVTTAPIPQETQSNSYNDLLSKQQDQYNSFLSSLQSQIDALSTSNNQNTDSAYSTTQTQPSNTPSGSTALPVFSSLTPDRSPRFRSRKAEGGYARNF